MKKEAREIIRIARNLGLKDAHIEGGDPHARIVGTIDGRPVRIVTSLSKAFANRRYFRCTKLNIKRAIEKVRNGKYSHIQAG